VAGCRRMRRCDARPIDGSKVDGDEQVRPVEDRPGDPDRTRPGAQLGHSTPGIRSERRRSEPEPRHGSGARQTTPRRSRTTPPDQPLLPGRQSLL
jgi:hypothetical protein